MNYETTPEIEIAVARFFDYRRNIIVPNVSWGLFLHECDLLVLTPTGYAYEVEIKVTRADLARDLKKRHGHGSQKIRRLYFAVPAKLLEHKESTRPRSILLMIPENAGIISVAPDGFCQKEREAKTNDFCSRFEAEERDKLKHLGLMRIWALRRKIIDLQAERASAANVLY